MSRGSKSTGAGRFARCGRALLLQGGPLTLAFCLAASGCSELKLKEAEGNIEGSDASMDASSVTLPMGDAFTSESRDSGGPESVDASCAPQDLYADDDGDGYGDPNVVMQACAGQDGFAMQAGDCDDTCNGCHIGGVEVCDGSDNDCDSRVDNVEVMVCGKNVGACKEGTRACVDGAYGDCEGSAEATDEICGNGADENCDGTADEGCPCSVDESRACGMMVGECTAGTQACVDGTWGECAGASMPQTELCDGKDNDCDDKTDEDLLRTCGSGVGECTPGMEACTGGVWSGTCEGSAGAGDEICDGKDNDCDGSTDEGLTRSCGTSIGECSTGTEQCVAGNWSGACLGQVSPKTEVCDAAAKDEDCDGENNEGCACADGATQRCGTTDVGPCSYGTQTCGSGQWNPTCVGKVDPGPAELCDASRADENCNGQPNEGCACDEGATKKCGTDTGECTSGLLTCGANGQWGTQCVGQRTARAEACNGVDDDCDGQTDEPDSGVCPGEYCVAGSCEPCTKATEAKDCGASTTCLKRECVANSCRTTPLTQCSGPSGQPGTCDALGTCRYCGDGVWSQSTERCDESVARWRGACQACVPTYFSHCNVYKGQTTCPAGETCAFTVCARTCTSVLDCPPEPSITCQELVQGSGVNVCVWACPSPDDSKCPDSQMICDNADFCLFPANL